MAKYELNPFCSEKIHPCYFKLWVSNYIHLINKKIQGKATVIDSKSKSAAQVGFDPRCGARLGQKVQTEFVST